MTDLEAQARAWLEADPDPATRDELAALLRAGDRQAVAERFENPLTFGTAGLRGPLGAGPARMNVAVVQRISVGLARYLADEHGPPGAPGTVVVGHDARYRSDDFARVAAATLARCGARVLAFSRPLPTPLTAFAVRQLGASAGVMVTASHNPAPDNGYKVYLSDGAQVFPPHDEAIARAAELAANEGQQPLAGGGTVLPVDEPELLEAYSRAVLGLLAPGGARGIRTVYTPVHGVGGAVLPALMSRAGFPEPLLVAEQSAPDPDFPTAPFPNPEEPGVLDLALALARQRGADIVLANDPDADRLAVAVPYRGAPGGWRVLTGDETGVLLGDHFLSRAADRHADGTLPLVATSVVSSTFLCELAAAAGVACAETLTGFKWLARAHFQRPGHRLVYAYEEALGYACSPAVADKDGLSAALVVAEMAAEAKARGRSLLDRLDELECAHGVHVTAQWSGRLEGPSAQQRLGDLMRRLRRSPPQGIGGLGVSATDDLLESPRTGLPPSDVLIFHLAGGGRAVLRPSGTEPKIKAYLQATTAPCAPEELRAAREQAQQCVAAMRDDVSRLLALDQA